MWKKWLGEEAEKENSSESGILKVEDDKAWWHKGH